MVTSVCLALLFFIAPLATAEMVYHGFQIDDHLLDSEQKTSFSALDAASVIAQLRIVESVGLPPDLLKFFKGVRIIIDPGLSGNPGIFSVRNGEGAVHLQPMAFPADKPIVLHELLHAYHYDVLSLKNAAILNAYEAARRADIYPVQFQKSHFLSNEKEFFAVTSTIYLFGKIQQPPFNCETLSKSDPAYLIFLESTFTRHECH